MHGTFWALKAPTFKTSTGQHWGRAQPQCTEPAGRGLWLKWSWRRFTHRRRTVLQVPARSWKRLFQSPAPQDSCAQRLRWTRTASGSDDLLFSAGQRSSGSHQRSHGDSAPMEDGAHLPGQQPRQARLPKCSQDEAKGKREKPFMKKPTFHTTGRLIWHLVP